MVKAFFQNIRLKEILDNSGILSFQFPILSTKDIHALFAYLFCQYNKTTVVLQSHLSLR